MKALAIHGKDDLRVEERDRPEPADGQVRLAVKYVGICGSDIHYYFAGANGEYTVREPLTPGHELSAVVDLDPSGTFAAGTPVTVHPARNGDPVPGLEQRSNLWPGGDYLGSAAPMPHRQGGACEYLIVERDMVRPLPDGLPLRRAALAEPLGVALHAIALGPNARGVRALVIGAGPIGLLVVAALVENGAARVDAVDVRPEPLQRAVRLGATGGFLVGGDTPAASDYDVVYECSGSGAGLTQAIAAARTAGTVVQVGILPSRDIGVNLAPMLAKELTLKGTFRFVDEIDDAIALLARSDRFDAVITQTMPLADAVNAFTVARDASRSAKVLLEI